VRAHIGLPPEQFAEAFPFHLALDRNLALLQVGQTLRRLCPDTTPGVLLARVFHVLRPEGECCFKWLIENQRELFLLAHLASGLRLRGQFMPLPGEQTVLFLGSPWFTDSAEIAERGLGFEDFAIHDSVVDLLQVAQAQKVAMGDAKELLAKLSAQRAELLAANERLRQQDAENRKLALIAARTDNAVVLTDAAGRTVWVNEGFGRLTGYSLNEMVGKKPGAVLQGPGTDTETVRRIGERLRNGEGFSEEILNYAKNGRSYWLAIEVQPIYDEAGRLTNFMAIESDITAQRAARQRLAIQYEVSRILALAEVFVEALPQVLQAICENLGWQVAGLWQRAGDELRFVDMWHSPSLRVPNFIAASRGIQFRPGEGLPGRIWAEAGPAWIPDVTDDANFPRGEVAAQEGLRGAFGFPVFVRSDLWGVVEFFSRKIEEPDSALLKTFNAVGNQIGQFIVRAEAQAALRATSTLQRAILESANYSIISTAPDGIIQTFNSTAERMLGYTSLDVAGRVTPALIHDADEVRARAGELTRELGRKIEAGFEAFVAKAVLGEPDEREWTYIRKDGGRFPVLLSVTALFGEGGEATGFLGVASDITERKRVARELLEAKEAAEAANHAKSDFLAMMSHEIRTPMNAVCGMTNLLLDSSLNPRQMEFAQTVAQSAEALLEIINNILDFSRIEAGAHFQLEEEVFSLPEMVRGVIRLLQPRSTVSHIALMAEMAPGLPDTLRCDGGRLRQVLVNLVGNGIKFTERGSVTLRVQCLKAEGHRVRLYFEVVDTGIGISADDMTQLFRPFSQADRSASRRRGGTGLGLAISKRIVELMGGRIGMESFPGQGSRFWFELDVDVVQTPASGPAAAVSSLPSVAPLLTSAPVLSGPDHALRILVAEDHDTNRRLAMFMLESLGYRADFAVNGVEAVEAWERLDPDVIFMDCQMPEMDGFEATREIRRREAARTLHSPRRVRIVALTANALKGECERCLAAGMDGYISKPFTRQQIDNALARRPTRADETGLSASRLPEPTDAGFVPEFPAQLCAELGDEEVHAIIQDFLHDLPSRVAEMAACGRSTQLPEVARLAHSLKGIGSSFGLEHLSRHCHAVEIAAQAGDRDLTAALLGSLPELVKEGDQALRQWLASRAVTRGHSR
jgi:PAS domain S-box-containing protein